MAEFFDSLFAAVVFAVVVLMATFVLAASVVGFDHAYGATCQSLWDLGIHPLDVLSGVLAAFSLACFWTGARLMSDCDD